MALGMGWGGPCLERLFLIIKSQGPEDIDVGRHNSLVPQSQTQLLNFAWVLGLELRNLNQGASLKISILEVYELSYTLESPGDL